MNLLFLISQTLNIVYNKTMFTHMHEYITISSTATICSLSLLQ